MNRIPVAEIAVELCLLVSLKKRRMILGNSHYCFRVWNEKHALKNFDTRVCTNMKRDFCMIKRRIAERFPNTWFITMKKKAPILKQEECLI